MIEINRLSESELKEYIAESEDGDIERDHELESERRGKIMTKIRSSVLSLNSNMSRLSDSLFNDEYEASLSVDEMMTCTKSIWASLCAIDISPSRRVGQPSYSKYELIMKPEDIFIEEFEQDVWCITLPVLLPRKKMKTKTPDYAMNYRYPITKALEGVFPGKRPRYYDQKAAVAVVHNFGPEQKNIDHDNFDYSHLMNCLAAFFLEDDSPTFYDLHICGRRGEKSYTEVYIMPASRFPLIWAMITVGDC